MQILNYYLNAIEVFPTHPSPRRTTLKFLWLLLLLLPPAEEEEDAAVAMAPMH